MKKLLLLLVLTLSMGLSAQTFTELTGTGLTGVVLSSAAWGDYDNDGDLDVLLTGGSTTASCAPCVISRIYTNNGDGTFSELTTANLQGVYRSSAAWGDYDNDGDLDIVLTGEDLDYDPYTIIYTNNGNGTFSELATANLQALRRSSVDWGDYDNDGDLDILLTGNDGGSDPSGFTKIYINNADGTFSELYTPNIPGVFRSSAAWGDYDNDGDLDFVLAGTPEDFGYGNPIAPTRVYKNVTKDVYQGKVIKNGKGKFRIVPNDPASQLLYDEFGLSEGALGVEWGSVDWGDYDNDGDLDILLTGSDRSIVYTNNETYYDTFTELTTANLQGVSNSSAKWGDYDNDGDLDILLTGSVGSNNYVSKIYTNNGDGTFSELAAANLMGVEKGSATWGDYDNDGDLDILLTGKNSSNNYVSKIYTNNNSSGVANTAPAAPTNLTASVNIAHGTVNLQWDATTDNETPQAGLSYNLYIKENGATDYVKAPMAQESNGRQKLPGLGNAMKTTEYRWEIPEEHCGASTGFTAKVQAVDHSFAGSAFSAPVTFTVDYTNTPDRLYVDADAGGNNDGSSWANAYTRLRDALARISGCFRGEIWVAEGTYTPPVHTNTILDDALTILDDVTMLGGFAGNETTANQRDWTANPTILTSALNSIVKIYGGEVIIDGFIFEDSRDNYILETYPYTTYGALININGDVQLSNSIFRNNERNTVYNRGGNLSVFNSLFHGNGSKVPEGTITNVSGNLEVVNSTIANNFSSFEGGSPGGVAGIYSEGGNASVINTIFNNNSPSLNNNSAITISHSLLNDTSLPENVTDDGNIYGIGLSASAIFADSDNGDYSLLPCSPAVNAGDDLANTEPTDLAGNPRIYSDTIDMGAYELQQAPTAVTTSTAVYVDASVPSSGDGLSWSTAFKTLTEAKAYIANTISPNCEYTTAVHIATGTYLVSDDVYDDTQSLIIGNPGLDILGGYPSGGGTRNPGDNPTILSGDLNGDGTNDAANSHTIITVLVDNITIDGFIIEHAYANSGTDYPQPYIGRTGGGVYARGADNLSINNCVFRDNTAAGHGTDNGVGGALINFEGTTTITNSLFFNNTATGGGGGAISGESGTIDVINCTIANNDAEHGGGIHINNATVTVTNSILTNNSGTNGNINDGGNGTGTLDYCLVFNGDVSAEITQTNAITDDPSFTDAVNGDFSLQESSPAIDAGDNQHWIDAMGSLSGAEMDLAGNPRLSAASIDMGAYELLAITPDTDNILYVNKNVSGGNQTGDSWDNATAELADALKWARQQHDDDDTVFDTEALKIYIAVGTYKPLYNAADGQYNTDGTRDNAFVMVENVQLYGGFDPENGIEDLNDDRILPSFGGVGGGQGTILSGDIDNTPNDNNGNTHHVLISAGDIGTALVDGLVLTKGNADGSNEITVNEQDIYQGFGGGMVNYTSSPNLTNVSISGTAAYKGGGMYNDSSSPTLINVTISGNSVGYQGGGIYNAYSSSPVLTNVSISGNTAANNGGGMYNHSSSPTLINVTISGNSVGHQGGGIYNDSFSSPVLTNVSISGNTAADNGGGMYNFGGDSPQVHNTIILGNTANDNPNLRPANANFYYSVAGGWDLGGPGNIDGTYLSASTIFADPGNGDYSLKPCSLAVNAGDNAVNTEPTDLAGNPRIYNSVTIDMGAYELQQAPATVTDVGTIYIDASVASSGNGLSWAEAFKTLAEAKVYMANTITPNCEQATAVHIATGTYLDNTGDETQSLIVANPGLDILGGYPAGGGTRNPGENPTILSGDLNGNGTADTGDSHTIITALKEDITIDGFIIEYAYADDETHDPQPYIGRTGGGIYARGADNLSINNCIFHDNVAEGDGTDDGVGGALINFEGTTTITNSLFFKNTATGGGGGAISGESGTIDLINCTIADNMAGSGGGIHINNATVSAVNSIFANNTAPTNGNVNDDGGSGTGALDYCLVYGGDVSAEVAQTNTIADDPLFTDEANNDYTLQPGSPAIDAGNSAANSLIKDLAGNARISNSAIDIGAYELKQMIQWSGSVNSEWSNTTNWTDGAVPLPDDNVLITATATNMPVIESGATVDDIEVEPGASLTVANQASLIVTGTATGSITVERDLTDSWHLVSTPVTGFDIDSYIADNALAAGTAGNNIGLAPYLNATDSWDYYQSGSTYGNWTPGMGYSTLLGAAATVSFTGGVATENVSIPMTVGTSSGFNLVGNPYPSFIRLTDLLNANSGNLDQMTAWFWDGTANSGAGEYVTLNLAADHMVPPAQGFFVLANTAGDFDFIESMQSHDNGTFYKTSNDGPGHFALSVTDGSLTGSADIYLLDNATTGFDNGYDSSMFGGSTPELGVYTHAVADDVDYKLAIQSLPDSGVEAMVVPVGVIASEGETLTFSLSGINNLPEGVGIYLEDVQEGTLTQLDNGGSYEAVVNTDEAELGRFFIHFNSATFNTEVAENNGPSMVLVNGNELSVSNLEEDATVTVYNLLGQTVWQAELEASNKQYIELNLTTGVYIAKLKGNGTTVTKKIVINR